MYVLADCTGYVIRFFPSFSREDDTVEKIVFDLLGQEYINKGYHIYMDKYVIVNFIYFYVVLGFLQL